MTEQTATEPIELEDPIIEFQSSETLPPLTTEQLDEGEPGSETSESEPYVPSEDAADIPETLTTTSFITTTGTPDSSKPKMRRRKKTKKDAYKEYIYGREEYEMMRMDPSLIQKETPDYRLNRTYDMRRLCNNKRIDFSRMVAVDEEQEDVTRRNIGKVPAHLFREPKIAVRETLGSKFRYLYNRRPPGVKVYFKNAKMDPKERPPFVSAVNACKVKF